MEERNSCEEKRKKVGFTLIYHTHLSFFIIIVNDKKIIFESQVNKKFKSAKIHLIKFLFSF